MAYVAPNWKNGQAPALDAAALQAISDAIVANQTKNTQQDSSISSLQTAVNGKSRVATGSYTGTGTYGSSNPNSITFPFTPKLVIIVNSPSNIGNDYGVLLGTYNTVGMLWFTGIENVAINETDSTTDVLKATNKVTVSGTKFSWYRTYGGTDDGYSQLNRSGKTYRWIAFG